MSDILHPVWGLTLASHFPIHPLGVWQRLAVMLGNGPEMVVAFWAFSRQCAFAPMNRKACSRETVFTLHDLPAKAGTHCRTADPASGVWPQRDTPNSTQHFIYHPASADKRLREETQDVLICSTSCLLDAWNMFLCIFQHVDSGILMFWKPRHS